MTDGIERPSNRLTRQTASKRKRKSKAIVSKTRTTSSAAGSSRQTEEAFYEAIEEASNAQLPELLDAVYEAGEKLKEKPILANVRQYRQAVKAFMNYAVNCIFKAEEKVSGFTIVKRKKFILVSVVDQKLQELAEEVLDRQRQQFDILDAIDQINGLLVDLVS